MLWLVDLDDTLFHASSTMFDAIHRAMNDDLVKRLGIEPEQAHALRKRYWELYGATFEGVWRHHGVHPHEFLQATHSFELTQHIPEAPDTKQLWKQLPGQKVVYTNGPRHYAETVLAHLGLGACFDDVITSSESYVAGNWHAKPSRLMLQKIMRQYRSTPAKTCLIDDSLKNLKIASQCGLKTVWMTGFKAEQPAYTPAYIDLRVRHLIEIMRWLAQPAPKAQPRQRGRLGQVISE